jgi:thymidylate synthase
MLSPARFHRFQDAYIAVLAHVGRRFDHAVTPRGNACHECLNISFVLDDPRDRVVYVPARRTNIVFCFAEALWYLWGRDDLEMISYYAPRLAAYSADGKTLRGTAYGPKLMASGEDSRSQWDRVMDRLAREPGSKRAVVSFFQPAELADAANPDVSCTLALQFMLRDQRLHAAAFMRGNDAMTGLLCDVFSFTLIQEFMAAQLGVQVGCYAHHVGSMHINETDAARAAAIVATAPHGGATFPVPVMPPTSWHELKVLEDIEGVLRRGEERLTASDLAGLGVRRYWQQVLLLFETYRQITHEPDGPVQLSTLEALDPGYQWLIAHRWPSVIPPGFPLPPGTRQ